MYAFIGHMLTANIKYIILSNIFFYIKLMIEFVGQNYLHNSLIADCQTRHIFILFCTLICTPYWHDTIWFIHWKNESLFICLIVKKKEGEMGLISPTE